MTTAPHNNQQVFSDHYLDDILPQRADWQALMDEAAPIRQRLATLFAGYTPGDKEAQAEHDFIRPVLQALGHTFEVQASLATPDGTKTPDYIFYRDVVALNANKGRRLTEGLLHGSALAVGDAKYWDCPLDIAIKGKGGDPFTNKNPSYQIAFYMQHSGLEWGILTNGRLWRLYHRSTAHKLDHFYEVNLPALLLSKNPRDFLYFYAFFRRAAFDERPLGVGDILTASLDYAQGISASLRDQVYEALRHIAQGFLDYAPNRLSPDDPDTLKHIYDSSLILLYRLLFIFYAEARDLLPMSESEMYRDSYSLRALTETVARDIDIGKPLHNNTARLYNSLQELFGFINAGDPPLKISTFNGGLFDPDAPKHAFLARHRVGDAQFRHALDKLARASDKQTQKHFIDYRDLSVRNLGTIYEGLLEYHLEKSAQSASPGGWNVELLTDKGERKATGSYYTPDYIVKYIVDAAIGPMLRKAIEHCPREKEKVEAALALKVLDPSMGSGHFLVEATEYIARFLVELNAQPEGETRESELAYWKRRVAQSCIYGVDLNPLAVELAKLSLWLSTVAKDRPLSFLDHHLRAGNALIGSRIADLGAAPNGKAPSRKAKEQEQPQAQLSLFDDETFRQNITTAVSLMWLVEDNPARTIQQVKEQEQLYDQFRGELVGKYGRLADLSMAAHYGVTIDPALWKPLIDFAAGRELLIPVDFMEWLEVAAELRQKRQFFHWELEFPEVFFDRHGRPLKEVAGFDVVIGNPPWIRQEMFGEDKAALKQRFAVYHGVADLYTYFVELGNDFLKQGGRFGFIIPNKFVRANYGSPLRAYLAQSVTLERVVDFGDLPIFHDAVTYPMIILTSKQAPGDAPISFSRIRQLDPDNLAASITAAESHIPRSALTTDRWSLDGAGTTSIIEKMKAVSTPLGRYVSDKIYYGIKTGFNEAFVIDQRTRDRLIAEDEHSAEIIQPFLVGEDVRRYQIDYKKRYLILTKIGTPIERYPAIFAHLQRYQEQLEKRWDKGNHWWELRACDYYDEFEKPKIIFPDIARRCQFAFDLDGYYSGNTTYFLPESHNQLYVTALLNSSLIDFFYRTISAYIRGDYLRFFTQYVTQIPIRSVAFTTPAEERDALAKEGIALYQANKNEDLLAFIEARLANQPEQGDVAHDMLVYLTEQMIDLHKRRARAVEDFLLSLESVLAEADLQHLGRLWTPPAAPKTGDLDAVRRSEEAQERLGTLAARILDLREDIGTLNEEQWKWLLKRRLSKPDLVSLTKAFREWQPPIAALDKRIAGTDRLIDRVVYRLYGLMAEEVAEVEGRTR